MEYSYLVWKWQKLSEATNEGMDGDIKPASDGIFGRVLPRLQAVSMAKVMRRLPVVERLITVFNWRIYCRYEIGTEKEPEGKNWLHSERRWWRTNSYQSVARGMAAAVATDCSHFLSLDWPICWDDRWRTLSSYSRHV